MQGSNVLEGFGLAGQAERLLALPGPFHIYESPILMQAHGTKYLSNKFCPQSLKTCHQYLKNSPCFIPPSTIAAKRSNSVTTPSKLALFYIF